MLVNSLPLARLLLEESDRGWDEKELAKRQVAEGAFYPLSSGFLFAPSSPRKSVHRLASHQLDQSIFKPITFI